MADTGVGFAIPVGQVRRFIEVALKAVASTSPSAPPPSRIPAIPWRARVFSGAGEQQSRYLGLVVHTVTSELIAELKACRPQSLDLNGLAEGVFIFSVNPGSPAAK
ncbi:unnamed protein product [Protopolystoma xenopodis]|uniref:Uncharacterized protein n=1 Tax=Protopolystoma xenopodis TaxID=117903 RepID=A0A448XKF8_9PLAT|nr:unnamed protein product [Protopolystoma xenopodis]